MRSALLIFLFLINFSSVLISQENAESYYAKYATAMDDSNYFEAKLFLQMAISMNEFNWKYHNSMGYLLINTRNYENAVKYFDKAIKLTKEEFNVFWGRGKAFLKLQKFEKAISDFNYTILNFPNEFVVRFGFVHSDRGKAYLFSGNKDKACIDFIEARNRNFGGTESYIKDFCN